MCQGWTHRRNVIAQVIQVMRGRIYLRVTFLESNVFSVSYTHTYVYIAIEDTRISARIYRWIVTDQRRDEKGEAGSLGGIFASERLFHDDVISRLWRFLS